MFAFNYDSKTTVFPWTLLIANKIVTRYCFVELDFDGQNCIDVRRIEKRQQLLNFQQDHSFGRISKELDEDARITDEVGQLEV